MKYVYLRLGFEDDQDISGMADHIVDVFGEHTGESFTWKWDELMSKEEAIAFAEKYLKDRRVQYVGTQSSERAWDLATEYVLLDIIPYIYGEALD